MCVRFTCVPTHCKEEPVGKPVVVVKVAAYCCRPGCSSHFLSLTIQGNRGWRRARNEKGFLEWWHRERGSQGELACSDGFETATYQLAGPSPISFLALNKGSILESCQATFEKLQSTLLKVS
jgi:hypothetical protein